MSELAFLLGTAYKAIRNSWINSTHVCVSRAGAGQFPKSRGPSKSPTWVFAMNDYGLVLLPFLVLVLEVILTMNYSFASWRRGCDAHFETTTAFNHKP